MRLLPKRYKAMGEEKNQIFYAVHNLVALLGNYVFLLFSLIEDTAA